MAAPTSTATPRKLRASCDACGRSKTRCDRLQPSCSRCVSQSSPCVYGISRKAGKPPRSRLAALPLPSPPISDDGAGTISCPDMTMTSLFGPVSLGLDSDPGMQDWLAYDDLSLSAFSLPTPTETESNNLNADFLDPTSYFPSAMETSETYDPAPSAELAGCSHKAKDVMRRLYCADPQQPDAAHIQAGDFDLQSVIARNREVVAGLAELLCCPCARTPHSAMLYASIISRTLLLYSRQAVANSTASSSQQKRGYSVSSGSSECSSSLTDNATAVTLQFPLFTSDANRNLQTAMTACLLISELAAVGELIKSLGAVAKDPKTATYFCPMAREDSGLVADASLIDHLTGWLRTEQQRVVREARSGMSALDEEGGTM